MAFVFCTPGPMCAGTSGVAFAFPTTALVTTVLEDIAGAASGRACLAEP